MKALEWIERAEIAEDVFQRMDDAWRAFNNLYAEGNVAGSELERLQDYLRRTIEEKASFRLISEFKDPIAVLLDPPVIDMRRNGRTTEGHMRAYREAPNAVEQLTALFGIIYQVRCNLQHGQKSPRRPRDRDLCAAAAPVIIEVVKLATHNNAMQPTGEDASG